MHDQPMTFPNYVMKTMVAPGESPRHVLENVLTNLWAAAKEVDDCAHVWLMVFDPTTMTWEGAWIQRTEDQWEAWLREHDPHLDEVIQSTIEALEREANQEVDDDGRSD